MVLDKKDKNFITSDQLLGVSVIHTYKKIKTVFTAGDEDQVNQVYIGLQKTCISDSHGFKYICGGVSHLELSLRDICKLCAICIGGCSGTYLHSRWNNGLESFQKGKITGNN